MNGNDDEANSKSKRTPRQGTNDAKSRNWRFLFDNLKRAVGYIYSMCEQDGDIEECKEAIMVLHNRIKEFEGLIQYIEVQASYETSDERPTSVAWEVPVSAIKQPSLPFQPNGDPQLYYYPCLPQAFPQYQIPSAFPPMIDPNLMNFMPYNQQYNGYPSDFLNQNGQQSPQFQQYNNADYYNTGANTNNNNIHGKKNYSKRRSGKKHEIYKSRSSDGHTSSVSGSSSKHLNSLDYSNPTQMEMIPPDYYIQQQQQQPPVPTNTAPEVACQPEIPPSQEQEQPPLSDQEPVPTAQQEEPQSTPDDPVIEETIVKSSDVAIDEAIDEAMADKSTTEEESNRSVTTEEAPGDKSVSDDDPKADWAMVSPSADSFVHVNSDGSDHSLPTSPDNKDTEKIKERIEEVPETTQEEIPAERSPSEPKLEEKEAVEPAQETLTDSIISQDAGMVISDIDESTEELLTVTTETSEETSESTSVKEENVTDHDEPTTIPQETEDKVESSQSEDKLEAGIVRSESSKSSASDKSRPSSDSQKSSKKGIMLSCSSDVLDNKESDVLSESGLSTMSSSSIQSSLSMPTNPLCRSTSWADLVRKGKVESPVPPTTGRLGSKYQSTPSRYLNHRQTGSHVKQGVQKTPTTTPALSKSKSLPNQRGLQTNKIVNKQTVTKRKESHVCEEGWCVSSGKSRIKTIPNSHKKCDDGAASKTSESVKSPAMSPRLSRPTVKAGDSRTRTGDTKTRQPDDKTKRTLKPKPVVNTKNISAKINSKPPKTTTKPIASKPSTTRPAVGAKSLVKARSLESNTKLSDKLKPERDNKMISKSVEALPKTETRAKKKDSAPSRSKVDAVPAPVIPQTKISTPTEDLGAEAKDPLSEPQNEQNVESSEKSIQTEAADFQDHVEIFSVPASSIYPKMEEDSIYRVMISKRKRQISEQSTVSTDTLEDDERLCLSPGRSPGRSPSSRSGGGRSPGKAPQLHQRLSSPSRRRNPTDTVLKNHQEKMAKAQTKRDKIQEEYKASRLKKIKIKEEQRKDLQEQQEKERAALLVSHEEKLARAEVLRDAKIAEVKRKAQEEEQKVNEIAFINTLEAQNRKMELLSKEQMAEAKRAELQEERKRRSEELQAKDEAVQERKLAIEADRLARIAHIEDKIKESQAKVDSNKLEKETAAREAAKEKALERELTRELIRQNTNPEIKGKSKGRQQTAKLKEWQEKAAMLSQQPQSEYHPNHELYQPPKWCALCNIKIVSEAVLMAHMIKRHQKSSQDEAERESQYIIDYTDELCPMAQDVLTRQKMLRKRSKKVKTRITNKITELPPIKLSEPPKECPNKNRLYRCIKAMKNQKTCEKGLGDLSRTLLAKTDITHLVDKGVVEQLCGMLGADHTLLVPLSKLLLQCSVMSTTGCEICVLSLPKIVDILHSAMTSTVTSPVVYSNLLQLTSTLLRSLTPCDNLTCDMVGYLVSKEILDNIQNTCTTTVTLKDEAHCTVLINSLQLLSACCVAMTTPNAPISSSSTKNDPSQLIDTLVFTKACNIVTLLYGVLLYDGPKKIPPSLSDPTLRVVTQCLVSLLDISRFSLHTLQTVLDAEGMSLELRHVFSYVLACASLHQYNTVLDLCVQLIGYIVFCHPGNQILLQNGPSPSILQLLSNLPFSYFSDMRSMNLLFPTLISACYNCPSNLAILQENVNKIMLSSYLKEQFKSSKEKHVNFYPRAAFQQALKFLEAPDKTPVT